MKHPIEIRDPNIDTDAIMQRIRENVAKRRVVAFDPAELPTFDVEDVQTVDDPILAYHLEQVRAAYNKVWPELVLAPSWATQLPVIGKIWQSIREQAHRLVLYYVEMTAGKQVGFNEHVVGSLNRLTRMQERIAELEQEIAALQKQLSAIQEGRESRE